MKRRWWTSRPQWRQLQHNQKRRSAIQTWDVRTSSSFLRLDRPPLERGTTLYGPLQPEALVVGWPSDSYSRCVNYKRHDIYSTSWRSLRVHVMPHNIYFCLHTPAAAEHSSQISFLFTHVAHFSARYFGFRRGATRRVNKWILYIYIMSTSDSSGEQHRIDYRDETKFTPESWLYVW